MTDTDAQKLAPKDSARPLSEPSKRFDPRRFGGFLVAGLVGALLGVALTLYLSRNVASDLADAERDVQQLQAAQSRMEERTWTLYWENETLQAELDVLRASGVETGSADGTPPNAPVAPGVFSDGVYLVGDDLPAGTYDGVVTGDFGYWARLKNTTGTVSGIIENELVRGPFVLTVFPTDAAVELRGVRITLR